MTGLTRLRTGFGLALAQLRHYRVRTVLVVLAVGYMAFSLLAERRLGHPPTDRSVIVLAAATQLPDVVDKTLAWNLGVLPNGRSLAHSVLVATVVVAVVGAYLASRDRRSVALAFGVGYLSHLVADSYQAAVTGQWADLAFLGWPLVPAPVSTGPDSIVDRFAALGGELAAGDVSPFLAFEFALVVLALALWASHGFPGPGLLRRVRPRGLWSSE